MDKVKELLAILDMDADHQFWAVQKYLSPENAEMYDTGAISLADLAFRSRDEVKEYTALLKETQLHKALLLVSSFLSCKEEGREFDFTRLITYREIDWAWWAVCAEPIHWIIAALIAKEQNGELKSKE